MNHPNKPPRRATITLPAQGDILSEVATEPHFMALRTLLSRHCRGPYSPEVDEFCLILRIDGDFFYWKQEGCDRMRRNKKERYICIDLYVPRARWQGVSGIGLRRYLAACAEDALRRMIAKLQYDKAPVEGDALLRDFALVKERYLPRLATELTVSS